jgi:hypothetical protein
MRFDPSPSGRVTEGNTEVGRVLSWKPGELILLDWHPADWKPDEVTKIEVRFEPVKDGTRIALEHYEWGRLFADQGNELMGWFANEVAAPLIRSTGPTRFGDWLTDRTVRRPSEAQSRAVYRDPVYHRPNFRAMLKVLVLRADDYLLEVGCGVVCFWRRRFGAVARQQPSIIVPTWFGLPARSTGTL